MQQILPLLNKDRKAPKIVEDFLVPYNENTSAEAGYGALQAYGRTYMPGCSNIRT